MDKPLASLSFDLDNQWSYMKTHGDPGWEKYPSYFDVLVPQVLDVLDRLSLKITFFIIGQDAALDKNKDSLKLLTERGHEVGNHSFHHQQWLHLYSKEELKAEISMAEDCIIKATGKKPVGFRGPGFSWSPNLLEFLSENGYIYDGSTFPTYLRSMAGAFYKGISNLNEEEKEQVKEIFGSFKEGMRPVKPYNWKLTSGKTLLEIPVTTIPILKTPFHMSYLLFLSRFSNLLMFSYLQMALMLCRMTRTRPSFLLHPTDFIDGMLVPELAFFPGMSISSGKKIELFGKVIKKIQKHFTLVDMTSYAQSVLKQNDIKILSPYPNRAILE
jgi:hypothetical protein